MAFGANACADFDETIRHLPESGYRISAPQTECYRAAKRSAGTAAAERDEILAALDLVFPGFLARNHCRPVQIQHEATKNTKEITKKRSYGRCTPEIQVMNGPKGCFTTDSFVTSSCAL